MKRDCSIVQDLCLLYEDDMVQGETKEFIERHLEECKDCRKFYADFKLPECDIQKEKKIEESQMNDNAYEALKVIGRKLKYNKFYVGFYIILMVFVVIGAFDVTVFRDREFGVSYWLTALSTDEVEVVKKYQLENGNLYVEFAADRGIVRSSYSDNGVLKLSGTVLTGSKRIHEWGWENASIVFDISSGTVILHGKSAKDQEIIYKKGDKLNNAPEDIEKKVENKSEEFERNDGCPYIIID